MRNTLRLNLSKLRHPLEIFLSILILLLHLEPQD